MGHRALVAVEGCDGARYDLYHAQWGADDRSLERVLDAGTGSVEHLLDALGGVTRLDSAATVEDVLRRVDPLTHEALLVLAGEPTVYLVVAVRIETATTDADRTAPGAVLVPVADVATAARIRRFARTVEGVLGDAVDAGLVSQALARGYLGARLAAHPDVTPDSLWLPLGQKGPPRRNPRSPP